MHENDSDVILHFVNSLLDLFTDMTLYPNSADFILFFFHAVSVLKVNIAYGVIFK